MKIRQATRKGWIEVPEGGVFDASYPQSKTRRGRYQQGLCPTLTAANMEIYVYEGESVCIELLDKIDMAKKYRIRKLTPTECFALMGVREGDVQKLRNCGVSESQQYKMAGNSIVVDVLMGIFGQMFDPQEKEDENQITFPWW